MVLIIGANNSNSASTSASNSVIKNASNSASTFDNARKSVSIINSAINDVIECVSDDVSDSAIITVVLVLIFFTCFVNASPVRRSLQLFALKFSSSTASAANTLPEGFTASMRLLSLNTLEGVINSSFDPFVRLKKGFGRDNVYLQGVQGGGQYAAVPGEFHGRRWLPRSVCLVLFFRKHRALAQGGGGGGHYAAAVVEKFGRVKRQKKPVCSFQ